MTTANLTLAYTPAQAVGSDRLPDLRLTLEPEYVGHRQNRATLADIDAMLAMARSGASARNRQIDRCRWAKWDKNGDLLCTMSLLVWPSDIDLTYTLSMTPGLTSDAPPVVVREPKDIKYLVSGSGGEIELPWLLEDAEIRWHERIGVWDAWSRPATPPRIEQERARLNLEGERGVYGVLHVRGIAVGYRHEVTARYRIGARPSGANDPVPLWTSMYGERESLNFTVGALWENESGELREEIAEFAPPECVEELLEACPEGTKHGGSIRVRSRNDEGIPPVKVYYNSCSGAMLDIRREES